MREQAKAFLQKAEDHMQGLNLINSTNLDYFQPQHQAEMINLKAQFFAALGDGDAGEHLLPFLCRSGSTCSAGSNRLHIGDERWRALSHSIAAQSFFCPAHGMRYPPRPLINTCSAAHSMFSESLTLWPLCWEAWMAWGKFCDSMYDKSKEAQWLEFLATCFLQVCNAMLHTLTLSFWLPVPVVFANPSPTSLQCAESSGVLDCRLSGLPAQMPGTWCHDCFTS